MPKIEAKKSFRRPYHGKNRLKWEYQCSNCKRWFPDKETQMDHIKPVGKLTCAEDLPIFVERLFCEAEGWRCLCKGCHQVITNFERKTK